MRKIDVRWANLGDVGLVLPLFDAYRQFYQKPSDVDFCQQFLSARLSNGESKIIVATDELGHALGFVQLYPLFSSLASRLDAAKVWLLNDLFVAPVARGLGVGGALLDFAQAFVRDSGAEYMMLETAKDNAAAQSLYEKQGWRRDEVFCVYTWRAASAA